MTSPLPTLTAAPSLPQWGQFELPPASVLIFATITILILVPINDRLVQPQLERKGWEPTSLQRAGFSQLWRAIAMAIAAIVCAFEEPMRSETMISHSNSVISVVFLVSLDCWGCSGRWSGADRGGLCGGAAHPGLCQSRFQP